MPDLKLTSDHDLDVSSGGLELVTGRDEIAQKLKIRLGFFKGEYFLDQRLGVPWIQQMFKKGVSDQVVRYYIRRVVLTTPGIDSIGQINITRNAATRAIGIAFAAKLTGDPEPLDYSEEFIP